MGGSLLFRRQPFVGVGEVFDLPRVLFLDENEMKRDLPVLTPNVEGKLVHLHERRRRTWSVWGRRRLAGGDRTLRFRGRLLSFRVRGGRWLLDGRRWRRRVARVHGNVAAISVHVDGVTHYRFFQIGIFFHELLEFGQREFLPKAGGGFSVSVFRAV